LLKPRPRFIPFVSQFDNPLLFLRFDPNLLTISVLIFSHIEMACMLFSALSVDAFVLPGSAVTSRTRTTAPAMNGEHEYHAKLQWFRKNGLALHSKGEIEGYHTHVEPTATLTYGVINDPLHDHGIEGVVHSTGEYMARIRKKQAKAVKAYVGKEVELCSDRTAKGW